jgi:4a-hydroxytetrahydrobiopterin dehydratase
VWALAQAHQHHPDVELSYGRVTLHLTTHDTGKLTDKDLSLALEINALALTHLN